MKKIEILEQMKQLITDNQQGAKDLLMENPQLAQALLLIEMSFDLVTPDDIRQLTEEANPTNPARPSAPVPPPPQQQRAPLPPQQQQQQNAVSSAPKTAEELASKLGLPVEQIATLQKVLVLSPEQISELPPDVQQQVIALKKQMGNPF